jgi:hypothetical protein
MVAIVREKLSELECVTQTWFEYELEKGLDLTTLVIEVNVDTDQSSTTSDIGCVLEEIEGVLKDVLENRTTMMINRVRVIPATSLT